MIFQSKKGLAPLIGLLSPAVLLGLGIFILIVLFLSGAFLRFVIGAALVGVGLFLLTKKSNKFISTSWVLIGVGILLMINPFDAFNFFNVTGGMF